jgi:hypothetical protein
MLLENALDGTQSRQRVHAAPLQLQADRLRPNAREAAGAAAVRLQLGAHAKHGRHDLVRCASWLALGLTTLGVQTRPSQPLEPAQPFGQPRSTSTQQRNDSPMRYSAQMQSYGATPKLILDQFIWHLSSPEQKHSEEVKPQRSTTTVWISMLCSRCLGGRMFAMSWRKPARG